jgi:hypothetical protein
MHYDPLKVTSMRRVRTFSTRLILHGLIVSSFVASSCSPSLKISLASPTERLPNPSFTVSDPDHPQQPQYDTVEVWDTTNGRETDKARLIWKMVAEPFGNRKGVAHLTYGRTIEGFKSATDPLALEAGHQYSIRVAGHGEGRLHFRVGVDGKLDQVN